MSEPSMPRYRSAPAKVRDHTAWHRAIGPLLDTAFFAVSWVCIVLLAIILLRQGFAWSWRLVYLVVFWLVLTYLALPRFHRLMTALYVPDYFIGRTRTGDGLLGDPVNLAMTGPEERVHAAMERAGWTRADPVDLTSSWRIVVSSVTRRSYPEAPVSPLFLFGRMQAFAYQQEVEGNPAQRHHVRFWPTPAGWLLPGGHRVDWLAAGTYDRAVGLSAFTWQITHKIDRDIDIERDYIIDTIRYADPAVAVERIVDFSTGYHTRNGGGDTIETDGDLPVLALAGSHSAERSDSAARRESVRRSESVGRSESVAARHTTPAAAAPEAGSGVEVPTDAARVRPPSVGIGILLILVSFVVDFAFYLPWLFGSGVSHVGWRIVAKLLVYVCLGLLAWWTYAGRSGARLGLLALLTLTVFGQLVGWLPDERDAVSFGALLVISLNALAIFILSGPAVRHWTARGKH